MRYCCDLMDAQAAAGHEVAMFYPAGNSLTKHARARKKSIGEIVSYEFYSQNMVPLVCGTRNPDALDQSNDEDAYRNVLKDFRPEVIHVHSIQGIGIRFFEEVKRRGVRTVFTTHDYYPICLRCNFINYEGELCKGQSPEKCARCNALGLSERKAALMQSTVYRALKDSSLVKRARTGVKRSLTTDGSFITYLEDGDVAARYESALERHREIISSMDVIHANSELAARYYRKAFPSSRVEVLPITHAGLSPHVRVRRKASGPFRIGYVGGANVYKGYKVLLEALAMLPGDFEWELLFYGMPPNEEELAPAIRSKVNCRGFYQQKDATNIFEEMDILVVPSIWPETFGFVVAEALCVGTPVICSTQVGASDLVNETMRYAPNDANKLASELISAADSENCFLGKTEYTYSIDAHQSEMGKIYINDWTRR